MSLTVTHEPDSSRYTVHRGDELQGWIDYDVAGGTLRMLHAEVPPLMRNKGVGRKVRGAINKYKKKKTTEAKAAYGSED